MKFTIKTKLLLFIILPIIIIYTVTSILNYKYSEENEVENIDKFMSIYAEGVAKEIESELRVIESIAAGGAGYVELSDFITAKEAFRYLEKHIDDNEMLLGARFIFEPGYTHAKRKVYSIYKSSSGIKKEELSDKPVTDDSWYKKIKETGKTV